MASAEPSPSALDTLHSLGWNSDLSNAFAPYAADCEPARVSRVDRGACDVLTATGERRVEHSAAVRRACAADPVHHPCVGDWTAVTPTPQGRGGPLGRGELVAVLPRRTALVRGGVGRGSRGGLSGDSTGQVLAANIDLAYLAEPAQPAPDLGRIERLQALAWDSGATPVVVLTKADLAADLPALLAEVALAAPGAQVHAVSALTGAVPEEVRPGPGRTAVLLGPSGAGKSTLVNALAGGQVLATQQVRAADGRGRHTTTHRELLVLPGGGLIIDTPGIRRIGLRDAGEGLAQTFSDVEDLAGGCRFGDCAHEGEPGCAVLAAVASGELPVRRLESWRKLGHEAAWMAARTDARLRAERTREWKLIHKELRRSGRNRP